MRLPIYNNEIGTVSGRGTIMIFTPLRKLHWRHKHAIATMSFEEFKKLYPRRWSGPLARVSKNT